MARHFGQEQYTLYKKVKRRQKDLDDAFERAMIEEEEKEERRRKKVFKTPTTDGLPDICKNCDVFQYGMSSENCNYCEGPKTFFYGDDK